MNQFDLDSPLEPGTITNRINLIKREDDKIMIHKCDSNIATPLKTNELQEEE